MARGRFISNYIIEDREFNELSNDTCRLAYVFLITLADREGRITGELGYLTSKLFPRRREITTEILKGFIQEWADAGFIIWYESENGHKALQLINFEKHQRGLRKDREPSSEFDNPNNCRIIAGCMSNYNQSHETVKELKDKGLKESLINNTNINVKPAKNAGTNPEPIRNQSGKEIEDKLEICFIRLTGLCKPSEHLQAFKAMAWEDELKVWHDLGVTEEDIKKAVTEADENKTNLSTTGSITSYIKSAIARRKRGINKNSKNHKKSNQEIVKEMIESGEI